MYCSTHNDPTTCILIADCEVTAIDTSTYEDVADGYMYLCTKENKKFRYFRDFILAICYTILLCNKNNDNACRINEIIVIYVSYNAEHIDGLNQWDGVAAGCIFTAL